MPEELEMNAVAQIERAAIACVQERLDMSREATRGSQCVRQCKYMSVVHSVDSHPPELHLASRNETGEVK